MKRLINAVIFFGGVSALAITLGLTALDTVARLMGTSAEPAATRPAGVAVLATPTAHNPMPITMPTLQPLPTQTPTPTATRPALGLDATATVIAINQADNAAEAARLENEAKSLALRELALGLEVTASVATSQANDATATRQAQAEATASAIVSAQLTEQARIALEAPERAQRAAISALWDIVPGLVIFGVLGLFFAGLLVLWWKTREPVIVEEETGEEQDGPIINHPGTRVIERQENSGYISVSVQDWGGIATQEQLEWVAEWVSHSDNIPVGRMYGTDGGPFTRARAVRFLVAIATHANPTGRPLAIRMSDGQTVISQDGKRYFEQVKNS